MSRFEWLLFFRPGMNSYRWVDSIVGFCFSFSIKTEILQNLRKIINKIRKMSNQFC